MIFDLVMKEVEPKPTTFGEALKSYRKMKKWSRQQLENRTQNLVSWQTIKRIENVPGCKPINGTRAALIKIFPQLVNFDH